MKRIIITLAVLTASILAGAQDKTQSNKTYTKEGKTFVQVKGERAKKASTDQVTSYTWKDSKGNEYPIVLHTITKGENAGKTTCYVVKTSAKTGKEYKYTLPDGIAIAEQILKENR